MPAIWIYGHFAVIDSIACKPAWHYGIRRIGLLEIDPTLKPPSRIDIRLKSVKRIIALYGPHYMNTNAGWRCWQRDLEQTKEKAKRWDKLYPLHIIAKDWPLPLPVYVE